MLKQSASIQKLIDERGEKDMLAVIPFKKSNVLIESRNTNTVTQNKILNYAMYAFQQKVPDGNTVVFNMSDITKMEGVSYSTVNKTLLEMRDGKNINLHYTIQGEGVDFLQFALYTKFSYNRGLITVEFTKEAATLIRKGGLKKYTHTDIRISNLCKRNSTFRLYELLLEKAYLLEHDHTVKNIIYDIYELKLLLCSNHKKLSHYYDNAQTIKKKYKRDDFTPREYFEEYPEDEPYPEWIDFKRECLDRTVEELNRIAKDRVSFLTSYEPIRKGVGGKVQEIAFSIWVPDDVIFRDHRFLQIENQPNAYVEEPFVSDDVLEEIYDYQLIRNVFAIFVHNEPMDEQKAESLLKVANGDIEKIKQAYNMMRRQSHVTNIIGWMIQCIKGEYWKNNMESYKDLSYDDIEAIDYIQEVLDLEHDISSKNMETTDTSPTSKKQSEVCNVNATDFLQQVEQAVENEKLEELVTQISQNYYVIQTDSLENQATVKDAIGLIADEYLLVRIKNKTLSELFKASSFNVPLILQIFNKINNENVKNADIYVLNYIANYLE